MPIISEEDFESRLTSDDGDFSAATDICGRDNLEDIAFAVNAPTLDHDDATRLLKEAYKEAVKATHNFESGAVSTTFYLHPNHQLTIAHLGDTIGFLTLVEKDTGIVKIEKITESHNHANAAEKERALKAGGEFYDDGYLIAQGVRTTNRVPKPGVAMTRFFGNYKMGLKGGIREPEILLVDLNDYDTEKYHIYLCVASDGAFYDSIKSNLENYLSNADIQTSDELVWNIMDAAQLRNDDNAAIACIKAFSNTLTDAVIIGVIDGHGGKKAAKKVAETLESCCSIANTKWQERIGNEDPFPEQKSR